MRSNKQEITMKRSFLLLITSLLIVACGSKTTKAEDYVPKRSDYTFRTEVRAINDDGEVRWDTIVVYLTDAKGYTQQLYSQAQPLDTTVWSKQTIGQISEDDWNFDGIPDLQVSMGSMNGSGNITYDVWLWDDTAHGFVYLETPAEIFDPYVDSENKMIVSTFKLDDEEEIIRYKWKDGKLVEVEREQLSDEEMTDEGDEPWTL